MSMNRRNRHILIVGIAVATACLASFGVYRAVTRIPVREVEVARSFVVVATRSLPPGVRLGANDVRLAAWPSGSPVPESFSRVDAVVNRALLASVVENEPLVQGKVARLEAGAGLPPSIPPGMRAMSVKVNEVIGVAGFIDPGTRVDLVVTIRKKDDTTSRTAVSNVQVLSAGTRFEQEKARTGATPSAAAVVTLLVTPQDAERIALAQAEGQIMLVLRNPMDTETTATSGVHATALFGPDAAAPVAPVAARVAPRKPPVVAAAVAPSAPKIYTVEAIRAAKRTEEVIR
jgi:pilus assembly protein CpaB